MTNNIILPGVNIHQIVNNNGNNVFSAYDRTFNGITEYKDKILPYIMCFSNTHNYDIKIATSYYEYVFVDSNFVNLTNITEIQIDQLSNSCVKKVNDTFTHVRHLEMIYVHDKNFKIKDLFPCVEKLTLFIVKELTKLDNDLTFITELVINDNNLSLSDLSELPKYFDMTNVKINLHVYNENMLRIFEEFISAYSTQYTLTVCDFRMLNHISFPEYITNINMHADRSLCIYNKLFPNLKTINITQKSRFNTYINIIGFKSLDYVKINNETSINMVNTEILIDNVEKIHTLVVSFRFHIKIKQSNITNIIYTE